MCSSFLRVALWGAALFLLICRLLLNPIFKQKHIIMKKLFLILISFVLLFSSCQKNCPDGYRGDACDQEIMPSAIKVVGIACLDYPTYHPFFGTMWDAGGYPDLNFTITNPSNTYTFFSSSIIFDVRKNTYNYWHANATLSPNFDYSLRIFEFDGSGSNYPMQVFDMTYQAGNGFPSVVKINEAGYVIEVEFEYEF